jgi:hypothetical protein
VLLLSHFLQLKGVWLAFPITDGLTAILVIIFLIPLMRRLQKMSKASSAPAMVSAPAEQDKV